MPAAVWASDDAYLSLTVRPGPASGWEGAARPVDWFSDARGEAWVDVPQAEPTATMRWRRPSGELWLLNAYWRHDTPLVADREEQLRLWSLGITAEESGFRLPVAAMHLVGFDPGGTTRDRARRWSYSGHDITLSVIEKASATMLANQLARGFVDWHPIEGLGDVAITGTTAGWALPSDAERWATLEVPPDLQRNVEDILRSLSGPITTAGE